MNNSSTVQCEFIVADKGIAAIDDIAADGSPDGTNGSCFDLQGRRTSSTDGHKSIILKRDNQGKVRKMVSTGR